MSSTDLERRQSNVAAIPDAHEWGHIERMSKMLAKSSMCPKAFKGKPDDLMCVAMSLRDTNVPFTLNTLNQCYVIDGRVEMMAQLKVAIAASRGWDLWFEPDECDDTKAVVHYKGPGRPERTMSYTVEEARKGHLLDEWVEQQTPDGKWPDGNPKYRTTRCTVSVDGEPVETELPAWAIKEVEAGRVKRKDPWFANRGSMLMARAVTKALRYAAPHLTLGVGDDSALPADDELVETAAVQADPSETGELVEAADAKEELIAAYVARGSTREQAIPCAKLLWDSHGLAKGEAVPRSRLDLIVSVVKDAPARKAGDETPVRDQAPGGDEPVGEPPATPPGPEHVTPEVVDGPPPGEGDDPQLFAEEPPF